jgi:hypothetical protein
MPCIWAAFIPTWLTRVVQVSSVSRVTRAVSTHLIGYRTSWYGLGFWMFLAVLAKSTAVFFHTLIAII